MFATLILYLDAGGLKQPADQLAPAAPDTNQFVAHHLTSGQVIDLLVCLDALGFLDLSSESDSI